MTREEAIEVYHGLLNQKIKEAFEVFAPELQESEDERIRKEILEDIRNVKAISSEEYRKKADRWIAWLEKQKEQKPAEYLSKEKVFAIMNKLTSLSFCVPLGSDEEKKIHEITCDVSSLLDYPIEQKPVEWSEEDEAMRDNILRLLSCFVGTSECDSNPSLSTSYPVYRREIDWLKSLCHNV